MIGWHAALQLDYQRKADRTDVAHLHKGPLRVLKSLYPEGPEICHTVLVHPPSGLVGGDRIDIRLTVNPQAHALITTPGAKRFYRTEKGLASQEIVAKVCQNARLEWKMHEPTDQERCDACCLCWMMESSILKFPSTSINKFCKAKTCLTKPH
jgi:urease accessory protein